MSLLFRYVVGLCGCCFLFSGCAGITQSPSRLSQEESGFVIDAFEEMRTKQNECFCLDAEIFANLAISRWIGGGNIAFSGYLQAFAPSSIRFTGINPLGQPQFLLIIANGEFQSVFVPEAKIYGGSVQAKTFVKYTPPGFKPDEVYSWLTGQVPGDISSAVIIKPTDTKDIYWLQFSGDDAGNVEMFLFDVKAGLLVKRILSDSSGNSIVEATYGDHLATSICQLPRSLTLASPPQKSTVSIVLHDVVDCEQLPAATFRHISPAGFEKIVVE